MIDETILIADDDQKIRFLLSEILEENGYKTLQASDGYQVLEILSNTASDLVLLDLKMPGIDGLEVLKRAENLKTKTKFIVITAHGTIRTAIEATRLGAYDFIEKPIEEDRILLIIQKALKTKQLEAENISLKEALYGEYEIIGNSRPIQNVKNIIQKATAVDTTVLITGNNGTGKDLIARNIHLHSARSNKRFVNLNCAALPENLIESELFGYEKGAFTGANKKQIGKFEFANEGTIFLNEIGDMSPATQAKLLHVLENRTIQRLGGLKDIEIDVRVVAATNKNLSEAMNNGSFRQDLFYRLQVIKVHVPDLKDRMDDILLLFDFFMKQFCDKEGMPEKQLKPGATTLLVNYNWPGNVRQLKNVVQNLLLMSPEQTITTADVEMSLGYSDIDSNNYEKEIDDSLLAARTDFERRYILKMLAEHAWNIRQTALALQIERTHLYKLMKKLGIQRNEN